ncbi:hypothetical protein GCM10027444_38240 [Actinopolyspora lacussalsi]
MYGSLRIHLIGVDRWDRLRRAGDTPDRVYRAPRHLNRGGLRNRGVAFARSGRYVRFSTWPPGRRDVGAGSAHRARY